MLKFLELNSIRSRMVSGFLFLTLLILILAFVSFYMLDRTGEVADIHAKINQLEVFTLNLIKVDNDFMTLEVTNEDYFKTRQSKLLIARDSILNQIHQGVSALVIKNEKGNYSLKRDLALITKRLDEYNSKFKSLEKLYFEKGFKDYGLEGEMRRHAHKLEDPLYRIEISRILYLRRNEKDFFLRHDLQYAEAFNKLINRLIVDLSRAKDKSEAVQHAETYKALFNKLVFIQQEIGLNGQAGYRRELSQLTSMLSNQYFSLSEYSYALSRTAQNSARVFYIIMLCGAILFSILSGYWISKRLSEPIARLSRLMNSVMNNEVSSKISFPLDNAAKEINTLTVSFIQLMDKTNNQMREIKKKSRLLKKRNLELKKLNRELDNFLYSTAHDLRSPLTSLLGLLNILKYDNRQSNLEANLSMMENSIYRMENFISQIVNHSKNQKMEIVSEKIDIKLMIDEIFENHQFVEGARRIRKQIHILEERPFFSDKGRMTILFNNLISNGIRYYNPETDDPFINIDVRISENEIEIDFSDNGEGIAVEHIDKIFNMFYRANVNSKGSGLGLFIFKETITKMKGKVEVNSTLGIGTKFKVLIPNLYREHDATPQVLLAHL